VPVRVVQDMVGHKFGEFSSVRVFHKNMPVKSGRSTMQK
jgi:ribosomal protein S19